MTTKVQILKERERERENEIKKKQKDYKYLFQRERKRNKSAIQYKGKSEFPCGRQNFGDLHGLESIPSNTPGLVHKIREILANFHKKCGKV